MSGEVKGARAVPIPSADVTGLDDVIADEAADAAAIAAIQAAVIDKSTVMPAAHDRDGICLSQTLGGAGNLALNGALTSGGAFACSHSGGFLPSLYSAGNLSGINFTITGTNAETGAPDTEVIAGPNAQVKQGVKYWSAITQIAANAAVGTAVEVGNGYVLYAIPSTARSSAIAIINRINSFAASSGYALLAILIPTALLSPRRQFRWTVDGKTAANANNKNISEYINATLLQSSGAFAANDRFWFFEGRMSIQAASVEVIKTAIALSAHVGLTHAQSLPAVSTASAIKIQFLADAASADSDAFIDAASFEVLNTP